ncbi:Hypothetical predicted protein [Cloeon dipterum]|uniref:Uncharacterized protein n=1 Tax=Cloeon dipterum TaxID=197152 RepID=A0A8S1E4B1_9INSE|nr:Hypothetical predicted protein [Cloeon dipterum]
MIVLLDYPSAKSQLESEAVFTDLFHDLENLVRPTRFPTWKGLDALADIAGFYPALDISMQFAPPEICCNAMRSLLHAKVATDKRVVTELENNFPYVVRYNNQIFIVMHLAKQILLS